MHPITCILFLTSPPLAVPLKHSKWVHTHWSGERATLTLVHLNKEDEGMYTLRVNTKSGFDTYSAYVFVRGKVPGGYSTEAIHFKFTAKKAFFGKFRFFIFTSKDP